MKQLTLRRRPPVALSRRRPLAAHITIWTYDLRLLASWWWLAAPVVSVMAALILSDSFVLPENRKASTFYPLFESVIPLLVVGYFAPLFQSEQQWRVGEVRFGVPESRLALTFRRLLLAIVLSVGAWVPAYVIASDYLGGWPLAEMAGIVWLPALTLASLSVLGGTGGSALAAYLVPFGYWVVHYALLSMTSHVVRSYGLTLFPAWAKQQFGADWPEAVAIGLQTAYWGHALLGMAGLGLSAWAVMSGWAGLRWSGEAPE